MQQCQLYGYIANLRDGAWSHADEGEENFDLCRRVEGAELPGDERQFVLVPRQVGARPAVLALELVEEIVHSFISFGHDGALL